MEKNNKLMLKMDRERERRRVGLMAKKVTFKSLAKIRSFKDAEKQFNSLNKQINSFVKTGAVDIDEEGNFILGKTTKAELKMIEAVSR